MSKSNGAFQITYEGGVPPSPEQVRMAVGYAGQVAQAKRAAGLAQMSRSFELDDGTQVYVLDLQHVRRVHIVPATYPIAPEVIPAPVREVEVTDDLFVVGIVSGAAHIGRGEYRSGKLYLKNDALDLVGGDADSPRTRELFTKSEASFKVAVERHQKFAAFSEPPNQVLTQLHYVLPGLYTGAMAPVVQLLLGMGKRLSPDRDYPARWFKHQKRAPDFSDVLHVGDVAAHPIESIDTIAAVSKEEEYTKTVIRYDYRANRTHGIVFGTRHVTDKIKSQLSWAPQLAFMYADPDRTREPFLVEVGNRGVYVMPLPRDPMSFFDEARAQYRKVYPALEKFLPFLGESEDIFSALGGIPTGECFPENTKDLQRWVRAGWAVKADISLDDVYQGASFVSSGHGWAFTDSGHMATTVSMKLDSRQLTVGYCWLLTFDIRQKSDLHWNVHGDAVISALGLNEFVDTFKAYLLSDEQLRDVLSTANVSGTKAAKDLFDDLEVSPWWEVKVSKSVVAQGYVDDVVKPCAPMGCFAYARNFKVFEPVLGAVVSYNFSSETLRAMPRDQRPEINGPVFSTFVGDDLEILWVYRSWDEGISREYVNTRQPCQFTGTYDEGWRDIHNEVSSYFYTSSQDLRKFGIVTSQDIRHVTLKEIGRASAFYMEGDISYYVELQKHVFGTRPYVGESFTNRSYVVNMAVQASNSRSAFFIKTTDFRRNVVIYRYTGSREWWGRTGTVIYGTVNMGKGGWDYTYHPWCYNPAPWWVECSRDVDPENCFGVDPPDAFNCYVHYVHEDYILEIFVNGVDAFSYSYYYTPEPKPFEGTTTVTDPKTLVTERIYGFGLPEIHGKILKEVVDRDESTTSPFSYEWDMCSDGFDCVSVPWYVLRNCYGAPFVTLSVDWDVGPVMTFGALPDLRMFASDVLFGIVE